MRVSSTAEHTVRDCKSTCRNDCEAMKKKTAINLVGIKRILRHTAISGLRKERKSAVMWAMYRRCVTDFLRHSFFVFDVNLANLIWTEICQLM